VRYRSPAERDTDTIAARAPDTAYAPDTACALETVEREDDRVAVFK